MYENFHVEGRLYVEWGVDLASWLNHKPRQSPAASTCHHIWLNISMQLSLQFKWTKHEDTINQRLLLMKVLKIKQMIHWDYSLEVEYEHLTHLLRSRQRDRRRDSLWMVLANILETSPSRPFKPSNLPFKLTRPFKFTTNILVSFNQEILQRIPNLYTVFSLSSYNYEDVLRKLCC